MGGQCAGRFATDRSAGELAGIRARSQSRRSVLLRHGPNLGLHRGAVGNLIDRLARDPGLFRGHVVDFIDYGGLFVGNVADIAIVGAAAAIMALSAAGLEVDGTRAGHHKASDEQPVMSAMAEKAEKADAMGEHEQRDDRSAPDVPKPSELPAFAENGTSGGPERAGDGGTRDGAAEGERP